MITFTQGGQLRFVDPRTFGEMFVTELDQVEKQVAELAHLGLDPLETALSWEYFGNLVADRHGKLKPLLMDQKFIAGIGNIYSDEILWGAGLRWDRMSDSLTPKRYIVSTGRSMDTLRKRWSDRRSSLAGGQYVRACSASRASTRSTTRCTRARGSRASGAAGRSSARRSPAAPTSTATPARCDSAAHVPTRGCVVPRRLPRTGVRRTVR